MKATVKTYFSALLISAIFVVGILSFFNYVLAVDDNLVSTAVTVGNATPSVTNVAISPSPIVLTENTSTTVTITADITDTNGCDSVFTGGTIVATLYREGVGHTCSADNNNCYRSITLTESANSCTGGADTSGSASGAVPVWYFAEATDAVSSFASDYWTARVQAADSSLATSTATSTAELNTTLALDVTASISYGTLAAGADTGATNQVATTTNTGNFASVNALISGTNMASGGDTLAATNQKYATTSVTYASLSYSLSTTPTPRPLSITKATSAAAPSAKATYWGIAVPGGQPAGNYTGTNTFTADSN